MKVENLVTANLRSTITSKYLNKDCGSISCIYISNFGNNMQKKMFMYGI